MLVGIGTDAPKGPGRLPAASKENAMLPPQMIALDCPSCATPIYKPLGWFKKTYATCPACGAGVAAGQFAHSLQALEQELDAAIEEMLRGTGGAGCCAKHHG